MARRRVGEPRLADRRRLHGLGTRRHCAGRGGAGLGAGRQLKFGNKNLHHSVYGTTPDYPDVHGMALAHGRMFTAGDLAAKRRVAVLDSETPSNRGSAFLHMPPQRLTDLL